MIEHDNQHHYHHEIINANPDLAIRLVKFVNSTKDALPHWHNSLEVVHILEGTLWFVINSRKCLLRKNDIVVINSRDVHSAYCPEPNDAMLIQIPYPQLKLGIPDIDSVRFSYNTMNKRRSVKEHADAIRLTLENLYAYTESKPDGYRLKTTSLIYDFLFYLYRHFRDERKIAMHKTDKYMNRLGQVTQFIQSRYREPLSLQQMAAQAYLDPAYFSRFFKKYMGVTPLGYLTSVRLQKIADELIRSDQSVTYLTLQHGCANYKLFLRQFKDMYGCTPAQYRKNYRKDTSSA